LNLLNAIALLTPKSDHPSIPKKAIALPSPKSDRPPIPEKRY
jgi:hypothetical protein